MLKKVIHALTSSSRNLLHNWRALIVLFVLYLAMFGAAYQFLQTREATAAQLFLSLLLVLAVPVLFLIIQTMAARYKRDQQPLALLGGALRDFWKMLVIAIPLILIAVLASYLFSKTGNTAPVKAVREVARSLPGTPRPVVPKPQPLSWQTIAINTLECLIFLLILPLAGIHLWIATARDGLWQAFKRLARIVARALTPHAVIAYAVGFVVFAVVPYFLVMTRTPAGSAWLDAGLLVVRLFLAMALSLAGWVVTVGALGELSEVTRATDVTQTNEGTGHVPAEA